MNKDAIWLIVSNLLKAYNVPITLVNNDQTCFHFIPTIVERTWKNKKQNTFKF